MTTNKEKPTHTVKLGRIEAAIWKNESDGKPRFNVTFRRLYAVEDEGLRRWRSTDSFGRDDLLTLGKVADLAHTWVCEQRTRAEAQPAT